MFTASLFKHYKEKLCEFSCSLSFNFSSTIAVKFNSVTHVVKAIQAAIEKKWTQPLEKLLLSDLRNIIKILTCKPVSFKTTVLAAWVPVSFVVKYKNFFSFCVLIFFQHYRCCETEFSNPCCEREFKQKLK